MRHDLSEVELQELASLYALGALSSDEALTFETHLSEGCMICAAELRAFEDVSAALALVAPVCEPSPGVRDKILNRLSEVKQQPANPHSQKNSSPQLLTIFAGDGEWKELFPGVFVKVLHVDREKQTTTSLFRMLPGARVPIHEHHGVEECYVIEGNFHINGQSVGPGDYHCAPAGTTHETLYTETGGLLLIIAPQ